MSEENKEMPKTSVEKKTTEKAKASGSGMKVPTVLIYVGIMVVGILIGVLIVKQPWKGLAKGSKIITGKYNAADCLKLGKYKGVKASIAVTQEDMDSAIEDFQDENTRYEEKQGTIQDGDMIYAVFDGYVDGKKVEDACGNEYVNIGSGEWFEGFEDAYVGAQTGKEISFELDVPEETFGDAEIDGHKVNFKATAKYICGEEIVPEYNDDLVQSVTEYKTTAEYEENLRQELAAEYELDKAEYSWTEVVKNTEVKKYPKDLLEKAKEQVLQDYYNMADLYQVSHDEIFRSFGDWEDEQDFVDNDLEELAQDTVKEQLIIEAIADKEKIKYTDEEYQAILKEEYEYSEDEYDTQKDYEKENKEHLEELALTDAVKNWIAEHANFIRDEAEAPRTEDGDDPDSVIID